MTFVRDKVVSVEREHKNTRKISSVLAAGGANFSSPWFIDASGSGASVLGREFNLAQVQNGPAKVAMWTYFDVSESIEGTTLYVDPLPPEYLEWVWEIPVHPGTVSVGYVTTGAATKTKREQGSTVEDIFREQLMKFPHLTELLPTGAQSPLNVTSFRCRASMESRGRTG